MIGKLIGFLDEVMDHNEVPLTLRHQALDLKNYLYPSVSNLKKNETEDGLIVTISERVNGILEESLSCHPSREENIQIRNAVRFLATQIDVLRALEPPHKPK